MAVGVWKGEDDIAAAWSPVRVVEPSRRVDRARWQEAVERAKATDPDLSALEF